MENNRLTLNDLEIIKKSLNYYVHVRLGHTERLYADIIEELKEKTSSPGKKRKLDFARKLLRSIQRIFRMTLHEGLNTYNISSPHINHEVVKAYDIVRRLNKINSLDMLEKLNDEIESEQDRDLDDNDFNK